MRGAECSIGRRGALHATAASDPFRSVAAPPGRQAAVIARSLLQKSAPSLRLCREAHAARADQSRIRRLEAPEGAAVGSHHINVPVVLTAKREVGSRQIAAGGRYRDKSDDDAARVDFEDAAKPAGGNPLSQ